MDNDTIGDRAYDAMIAAKVKAVTEGRKMTRAEVVGIINACAASGVVVPFPVDRKKIPPTADQVTTYAQSIGFDLDGQQFCDHYDSKGWMVGKVKMRDWQAAVRTWRTNGYATTSRKPVASNYRESF